MDSRVLESLKRISPVGESLQNITLESKLFDGGLELDSLALLDVVLELEQIFGVKINEDDINIEDLTDIGSLIKAVLGRLPS